MNDNQLALTVELADRADVALVVIRELLDSIDLHSALFDETIPEAIKEKQGAEVELALGVRLTPDQVVNSLEKVITVELIDSLQSEAVDELGAYIIGRSETFTFTIPLDDQLLIIEEEFKHLIQDVDLSEYIINEVLEPALDEFIIDGVYLPLGVTISRSEIRSGHAT